MLEITTDKERALTSEIEAIKAHLRGIEAGLDIIVTLAGMSKGEWTEGYKDCALNIKSQLAELRNIKPS